MAKETLNAKIMLLSNTNDKNTGRPFGHCADAIVNLFSSTNCSEILFIPYAKSNYEAYTAKLRGHFREILPDVKFVGIHEKKTSPLQSVRSCVGIFIGGGNTFRLLRSLQENDLILPIRQKVLQDGVPFLGSSAGSIVATPTINLTNDMAIVWPKSQEALGLVPFYMNAHYDDTPPASTSSAVSRDDRIKEFIREANIPRVLGLREGSYLHIHDGTIALCGTSSVKIFSGLESQEFPPGADLNFLL